MQREYTRLQQEKNRLEKELTNFPEGKLILCANGANNTSWFVSDGHEKKYLKRSENELAQKLAYKKVLQLQLEEIEQEMRAINYYLRHHKKGMPKSIQAIENSPELQKLVSSYFIPLNQELNNWTKEPYKKKEAYGGKRKVKTCTGEYVRSKSEAFIYTSLYRNKIPFRYEAELKLGSVILYPDFTIRHPKTGKTYYWEHFGLMDLRDYAKNTFSKMELYHAYGIDPADNFIMTFESKDNPLSLETIERIIEEKFL